VRFQALVLRTRLGAQHARADHQLPEGARRARRRGGERDGAEGQHVGRRIKAAERALSRRLSGAPTTHTPSSRPLAPLPAARLAQRARSRRVGDQLRTRR